MFKLKRLYANKSRFMKQIIIYILTVSLVVLNCYTDMRTAYAVGDESSVRPGTLNVRDYGARGDGSHDDSGAFQRAINDASARNVPLLIPPSDTPYLIRNTLMMQSNLHLIGYGATLFMPSSHTRMSLLGSNRNISRSNIIIEGLTLKSISDRAGTGYHVNSLTSNIVGIFFIAAENVRLDNITMFNVKTGLKFAFNDSGKWNRDIKVNNLQIFNAGMAFYANSTENLVMTNSILDADAGASRWLHTCYISGNTRNFLFENVKFINSPGNGIGLFNGHRNKKPPQNMVFRNCVIDNARTGVSIFSGSKDVDISGLNIMNYGRAFNIWDSSGISINDVAITQRSQAFDPDLGIDFGFIFFNVSDTRISNVTIDGAGNTGRLFLIAGITSNLKISSINAFNLNNNPLLFANTNTLVNGLVFEDSRIEWASVERERLSLRGPGSDAIFRNNAFINNGSIARNLSFNTSGTNVLLENNSFLGFRTLSHPHDHARAVNNTQL